MMNRHILASLLVVVASGGAVLALSNFYRAGGGSDSIPRPATIPGFTPPLRAVATPMPRATFAPPPRDTRSKQQRLNDELSQAAWGNDEKEVVRLLRMGAQINGLSSSGNRPLCQAVAISSHAGNASEYSDGDNPRSADMVKFLLARGADPNLANRDWYNRPRPGIATETPLELALGGAHECSPQPAIVRALLRAGADPNAQFLYTGEWVRDPSTPLAAAAIWGDTNIMRMLLRGGARVNGRDIQGRTPLMHASRTSHIWNQRVGTGGAMYLLRRRGAQVEARDNKGWSALFHAVADEGLDYNRHYEVRGNANIEAVKRLLRWGSPINARDKRGRTPLMYAASYRDDIGYGDFKGELLGQDALVRLLLQSGADRSARDTNGRTARDFARRAKNLHVLRALDKYKSLR